MSVSRFALLRRNMWAGCAALLVAGVPLGGGALAQDTEDEDSAGYDIVVTASVRQGGAQDIRHFRSVSLDGSFLPETSDLTLEGLMGEHDLTLPTDKPCRQTFCLTGMAMPAALPLRPEDRWFVGLGFASAIDADNYKREPISLVAVVDRSGSMSGTPMAHVKQGLHAVLGKLRPGDRLAIVTYGSTPMVHLPMTDYSGNREQLARAIDGIEIEGSTAMEAGLAKGYEVALEELEHSKGKTRIMLFTDENPNVGNTSAAGFMAQAERGSRAGVGLTTIGVGVHFDAALATHVSSVRGGNLFFLDTAASAKPLFEREFYNMVSEVAHDVAITMTPPEGFRITGVFGVPDDLMTSAPEGAVTARISTAFLSGNGGGIYVTLGKDSAHANLPAQALRPGQPLLTGTLSYLDALSGKTGGDTITVTMPEGEAPEPLVAAHLLVDEFLTMNAALDGYHDRGDKKGAYHLLNGLSQRIAAARLPGFSDEGKLVDGLRNRAAYVAGYAGEMPRELQPLALRGEWRVVNQSGLDDIARGDRVEITGEGEFITTPARQGREEVYQQVEVNERQLFIRDADLVFNYRMRGDRLELVSPDGLAQLEMRRLAPDSGLD